LSGEKAKVRLAAHPEVRTSVARSGVMAVVGGCACAGAKALVGSVDRRRSSVEVPALNA